MANPRNRSFLGIAKEVTKGTAVAPTDYIPVKNINPMDNITYLQDTNWRGSMVDSYGQTQGVIFSEFEFEGDVFPDTIGYPLAGVLGDAAISGASAPYTHTMAVKNSGDGQATSYTLTDYYGRTDANPVRRYPGCQFSEVDFKFSADGLLEYTAKATGWASAVSTLPTPTFSAVSNVPVWVGTASFAGTNSLLLQSGNVAIKRPVTPIHTVDNSQSPYQVFQGPVSVDGSLTLILEDDTQLNYYLNNTQPAVVLNWQQGTGATLTQVQFTMTKCAFTVGKIVRSKDYVELEVSFIATANTTDVGVSSGYSPIKVQLKNAKSTALYA